jgi:hypothetical protein
MEIKELKQMVGRECEFLSYYLDEYNKQLATNPNDQDLKRLIATMHGKWEAYDKVYNFICGLKVNL